VQRVHPVAGGGGQVQIVEDGEDGTSPRGGELPDDPEDGQHVADIQMRRGLV
jgi:hypothetical protein